MNRKISVIGLGYVGLPVAVAFGQKHRVIGFDVNKARIKELQSGIDSTLEVEPDTLKKADILYSDQISDLSLADFHIVAVPTPITDTNQPDLTPLLRASSTVGKAIKNGDIVVFESTVYPGATEEDCIPILEKESGLIAGKDFTVGYSPERINPGDKEHTFTKILKVVSGQDTRTTDIVAEVYGSVVTAGIHKAPSIKSAEAAKVIENTQRDLNIALMNELAIIFKRMDIDTLDVLEAAGTKWNFLPFRPGLVGGHCIGVDPYYLTHKAQKVGYHPQVILAGRRTNDSMARYVVSEIIKQMLLKEITVKGGTVALLGLTFKEDCPDLRNSKVVDIIKELHTYGVKVLVHDPLANKEDAKHEYDVDLTDWDDLTNVDSIIIATAHKEYKATPLNTLKQKMNPDGCIFDIKGIIDREEAKQTKLPLWRL
ncbi:MAG: nucleotide sugar dehydrogenase [Cellvibrionaceae bacterium]